MDPLKPLVDSTKSKADDKRKDAWHGHRFHGAGTHSNEATAITRTSSVTLVVIETTNENFAVQLPLAVLSTAASSGPQPVAAVVGDVVEVCVDPGSERSAYVWYDAAPVTSASAQNYEDVAPGKCRLYRYVSGAVWNRYT